MIPNGLNLKIALVYVLLTGNILLSHLLILKFRFSLAVYQLCRSAIFAHHILAGYMCPKKLFSQFRLLRSLCPGKIHGKFIIVMRLVHRICYDLLTDNVIIRNRPYPVQLVIYLFFCVIIQLIKVLVFLR